MSDENNWPPYNCNCEMAGLGRWLAGAMKNLGLKKPVHMYRLAKRARQLEIEVARLRRIKEAADEAGQEIIRIIRIIEEGD